MGHVGLAFIALVKVVPLQHDAYKSPILAVHKLILQARTSVRPSHLASFPPNRITHIYP